MGSCQITLPYAFRDSGPRPGGAAFEQNLGPGFGGEPEEDT